jgi:hypothetical protein
MQYLMMITLHGLNITALILVRLIGAKKRAAEDMSDGTEATTKKPVQKRAKRTATATATTATVTASKGKEQSAPAKKVIPARAKGTNGIAKTTSKTIAVAKAKPLASKQKKAPATKKPGECIHYNTAYYIV